MENSARIYAYVLLQIVEEKKDAKDIARQFVHYMDAKGKKAVIPHVLKTYEQLRAQKDMNEKTHVYVAQSADVNELEAEIQQAITDIGGTDDTHTHTDEALIGGFIVRKSGKQLDSSYKRGLVNLYNTLTKHHG